MSGYDGAERGEVHPLRRPGRTPAPERDAQRYASPGSTYPDTQYPQYWECTPLLTHRRGHTSPQSWYTPSTTTKRLVRGRPLSLPSMVRMTASSEVESLCANVEKCERDSRQPCFTAELHPSSLRARRHGTVGGTRDGRLLPVPGASLFFGSDR